ncbi:TrlF family AAA-like ATPase [Pseudidiomarina homiensis]|uniref:TrlF family AAA-like ATPase n=1 Tax=Pseudidiomarina homiensis TaxID=364198 RepID=UPI00215AD900|nr:AAA family ATPase [Pseudidiomarina homiensis]
MNNSYQGMRWLKCDLQMQTPADTKHWQGEALITGQEQDAANKYAEACFEAGLDIVGITEHNFLNRDFLPLLENAFSHLKTKYGRTITIFPGFEFEAAGVGRGCHILCLFEPGTALAKLDAILTECGVGFPRVKANEQLEKSDKNLKEILKIVQQKHSGIVIMPHATSNDGIFDNESISDWLQQDQFTNPELLAIEVPRPVHLMTKGYQRLLLSGEDCQPGWRRERPIATVMSSDNKMLLVNDNSGRPVPNSIGYRYSWIKMSNPSIESLRQAFLDPESRIKLPEDVAKDQHPDQLVKHSFIKSIKVERVEFLEEQEVHFSPNKNCFIGGRGSGKSTLQEYLRIVLGKDSDGSVDNKTKEKIERIKSTLSDNSKLTICWVSDTGVEDEIIWNGGELEISGLDQASIASYLRNLPVQFFSQQQLNQLTETEKSGSGVRQSERLLELIDAFDQDAIAKLREKEKRIKSDLEVAFSQQRQIEALKSKGSDLRHEYAELERQWKARSAIQADATKHQQVKSAESSIEKYTLSFKDLESDLEVAIRKFDEEKINVQGESPFADFLETLEQQHRQEKEKLLSTVTKALEDYKKNIDDFLSSSDGWAELSEKISTADEIFQSACERLGLSKEDASQLQDAVHRKNEKQQEVEDNRLEVERLSAKSLSTVDLISELHGVWLQQFEQRKAAANKANELVEQGGKKFLVSSVHYQHSEKSFNELWESDNFRPNGRTRLGRNWPEFGRALHEAFTAQNKFASPWALLDSLLATDEPEESLGAIFNGCEIELIEHLKDKAKEWELIKTSRVEDVVDLKLYRSDETLAGSIANNSLSDGQRNTAALVLLLAQGEGPLVIDQPEDELDSNFVSKELIPMLRKVKPNRQLILATHNANLPVNGDAELVYAFEARGGRGNVLACGGLDRKEVTNAILDIMEGSKEAFASRREKYGF